MKTWDYLERIRAAYGDCSDYRLAKLLHVRQQALTNYRNGRQMDDAIAARAAELLELPPGEVLGNIRAVRAESEGDAKLAGIWRDLAAMSRQYARAAVLVAAVGVAGADMVGRVGIEPTTNWLKAGPLLRGSIRDRRKLRRRRRRGNPKTRPAVSPKRVFPQISGE